jgi:hypothetical protein
MSYSSADVFLSAAVTGIVGYTDSAAAGTQSLLSPETVILKTKAAENVQSLTLSSGRLHYAAYISPMSNIDRYSADNTLHHTMIITRSAAAAAAEAR